MATYSFTVESMVRGYHVYSSIWEAEIDEILPCLRETNYLKDPFAVSVVKSSVGIVGHIPRLISSACSLFIRRGGSITCQVIGTRCYSRDLPQGGVEIPCTYTFTGDFTDTKRLEKFILEALDDLPSNSHCNDCKTSTEPLLQKDSIVTKEDNSTGPTCVVEDDDDLPPALKKRKYELSDKDMHDIIMGERLTQDHIFYAQQLLKAQFPSLNGLQSTLLQEKPVTMKQNNENKVQIIHSCGNHWIAASSLKCTPSVDVAVYDSVYRVLNEETEDIICNLFQVGEEKPIIKVMNCSGGVDCGLFAVTFITSIAYNQDPSQLQFLHDKMRIHWVNCFKAKKLEPFPCKNSKCN